jgi:hypothetical protein
VSVRITALEIFRLQFAAHNIPLMPVHASEVRPRRDQRGVDLISNALPFGRLWYAEPNAIENAIDYAKPAKKRLKRLKTVREKTIKTFQTIFCCRCTTRPSSQIVLSGGLTADRVIFNFPGTGAK